MLKIKTKKYAFVACCAMLSLLLLILSGCDATSDPKVYYQATGSWEGTIGADRVKGIVAQDGSYHLALVDATGAFHSEGGEYVGKISSINPDNIGSMSITRLQSGVSSGPLPTVTFILSANQLRSDQGIVLTRTLEANGPALQEDVAGHWSLSVLDNTAELVIGLDGTLNGNDGFCKYSGSLKLQQPPAWNIYSLSLTISDNTYLSCSLEKGSYSGLAMRLNADDIRPRLWLAANSGSKTYLGEWSKTDNVAPVAEIAIIGEREDQTVQVQKNNLIVELDAQLSSDANNDSLSYTWSGTDPDGNPLEITAAGSAATFVPMIDPDPNRELWYSITLTVDDGIESDTVTRAIRVVWLNDRFIDCKNGTILDSSPFPEDLSIKLIWLKNAGCPDLHGVDPNLWWVNQATAKANVASLAAPACGLSGETIDNPWRLPLRAEFETIMASTTTPPALVVGGLFDRVGFNPYAESDKIWVYWTSELVEGDETLGYYVNFENYNERSGSMSVNSNNAVWPVRTASEDEVSACQ